MYHYCKRLSLTCRKQSLRSETLIQTLVNRTNCDIETSYEGVKIRFDQENERYL